MLYNQNLKLYCQHLKTYLKYDASNSYGVDGKNLFKELKVITNILTIKSKSNFIILTYLFFYFQEIYY